MGMNARNGTFSRLAGGFAAAWLKFAGALGRINSFLLLSVVFYVFLTPLALLYRAVSGRGRSCFFYKDTVTMFRDGTPDRSPSSFEKTW